MKGTSWAALLRGINVGGRNKLPMADLRALFEQAGCTQVQTYIQSGNVLFDAQPELAQQVPGLISQAIADSLDLRVPVVLRSAQELRSVLAANPFPQAEPKRLSVAFLAAWPEAAAVASLDPQRSPGDRFQVVGREVFLHMPNGTARSKLTNAWMDRKLGTVSTARNWKTVSELIRRLDTGRA